MKRDWYADESRLREFSAPSPEIGENFSPCRTVQKE